MSTSSDNQLAGRLEDTAKQSGSIFALKIVVFVVGFFLNFVLARFFGSEVIGEYSLLLSVINMALIFSVFGLDVAMIKFIPISKSKNGIDGVNLVSFIALVSGVSLSIVMGIVLWLSSDFIADKVFGAPQLHVLIKFGSIGIIPLTATRVLGGIYKGFRKSRTYVFIFELLSKIIILLLVTVVALLGYRESAYVAIAWVFCQLVIVSTLLVLSSKFGISLIRGYRSSNANAHIVSSERKTIFGFASTMILVAVMTFMLGKLDIIMIGIFMTPSDVGVYKVALIISSLVLFVMSSSNSIFPSHISELYHNDKIHELRSMYSSITKWIIVSTFPIVVSIIVFSVELLSIFGLEFISGAEALVILTIGFCINTIVGSNGYMLNMSGYEKVVLANNASMGIMNIILNVVLIPEYGIVGAAAATSVSVSVISIAKVIEVKILMDIFPYDNSYTPVVVGMLLLVTASSIVHSYINSIIYIIPFSIVCVIVMVGLVYAYRDSRDELIIQAVLGKLGRRV